MNFIYDLRIKHEVVGDFELAGIFKTENDAYNGLTEFKKKSVKIANQMERNTYYEVEVRKHGFGLDVLTNLVYKDSFTTIFEK